MIVILAGLPGVGKTTLAHELMNHMNCYYLNRDHIRDALFPDELLDYSDEQNALASDVTRNIVRYIIKRKPDKTIIVDGRPFSKNVQLEEFVSIAEEAGKTACIIHCVAPDEVIKDRLQKDPSAQETKRTWEKVSKIKQAFEPIPYKHLKLDMTNTPDQFVRECLDYIHTIEKGQG